jgi:dihydrofolate reductase
MTRIVAMMTVSLDGYYTGPDDGPGRGLGDGGERLHYWVFGGPWTYDEAPSGDPDPIDKGLLDAAMTSVGAVVIGRWTFEGADRWGGQNPFGVPIFVVTHRLDEEPPDAGFTFVGSLDDALAQAAEAAAGKDVSLMGGDIIRQVLAAGRLDELTVTIAPLILGGGKRLFDGFSDTVELEQIDAVQSPWVTHLRYRVKH